MLPDRHSMMLLSGRLDVYQAAEAEVGDQFDPFRGELKGRRPELSLPTEPTAPGAVDHFDGGERWLR